MAIKFDRRYFSLFLLVLVVFVSGCTSSSGSDETPTISGNGISILEFGAGKAEVDSNEDVFVELVIRNDGDQKAQNVQARLFNPPFGSCPECWKIKSHGPNCGLLGEDWICLGDLLGPDFDINFDGDEKDGFWILQAPAVPSGLAVPTRFFTRIHYSYETQASTFLELVNRREMKDGEVSSGRAQITNSHGPVQFSSETDEKRTISAGQDRLSFCIRAENVGSGKVYGPDSGLDFDSLDIGKLRVRVSFGGLDTIKEEDMKIGTPTCFDFSPGEVPIRKTVPLTITGRYNYFVDDEFRVDVRGV